MNRDPTMGIITGGRMSEMSYVKIKKENGDIEMLELESDVALDYLETREYRSDLYYIGIMNTFFETKEKAEENFEIRRSIFEDSEPLEYFKAIIYEDGLNYGKVLAYSLPIPDDELYMLIHQDNEREFVEKNHIAEKFYAKTKKEALRLLKNDLIDKRMAMGCSLAEVSEYLDYVRAEENKSFKKNAVWNKISEVPIPFDQLVIVASFVKYENNKAEWQYDFVEFEGDSNGYFIHDNGGDSIEIEDINDYTHWIKLDDPEN